MTADAMDDMDAQRTQSMTDARSALEHLRDRSGSVPRHHPAPPHFINALHAALMPIATGEKQQRYRLDNAVNVPMGYLHDRVVEVLGNFDNLLTERTQEQAERQPPN